MQTARRVAAGPDRFASEKLDGLQIGGGQLAPLAHNVVAHLLPFIEGAHAGTLDRGNMDEHVLSAVLRLDNQSPFGN